MWKRFRHVLIASMMLTMLCILGVIPAYVQDRDSRDYYPMNCDSDNDEWIQAPEAEEFVLTRLNQWRLSVGVSPLERNDLLNRVASQQLGYISQFAPFSLPPFGGVDNFRPWHLDATGGLVADRLERNGWPSYDTGLIIGSEIAAYYPDINQSINFWQRSPVHNSTATLSGLREVGIHVECWKGWLLTYVVMASRPQTLTVIYDPHTNALYFGDESRSYANYNIGFRPDFYQMQDMNGNRLHQADWLVWGPVVQLPPNAPNQMRIVFTDGVTSLTRDVDLNHDRIFPSQANPSATPTLTPSATATDGPSPTPRLSSATVTATSTPPAINGNNYDIVLYFNQGYITLVNETGQRVNLEPLAFHSFDFPVFEIGMPFLAQPFIDQGGDLSRFPANSCIQAFSSERFTGPGENPTSCLRRLAYRSALEPSERFWLRTNFQISFGLQTIASCQGLQVYSQNAVCGFDLPDFALEGARLIATPNFAIGGGG
jgi:hypothetical protein